MTSVALDLHTSVRVAPCVDTTSAAPSRRCTDAAKETDDDGSRALRLQPDHYARTHPLARRRAGGLLRGPERRALLRGPPIHEYLGGHIRTRARPPQPRLARLRAASGD